MKSKTLQTILILAALACGCDDNNGEPPTSDVPSACVGIELLHESEACIEALSTKCRAETTESGCWAVQSATVGDQAMQSVGCRWTHVAVLGDADTCEISSAFGRCEAAVGSSGLGNPPVADPCMNGAFGQAGHSVITDSNELIDWVEAPDDRYSEVIGPWGAGFLRRGSEPSGAFAVVRVRGRGMCRDGRLVGTSIPPSTMKSPPSVPTKARQQNPEI